MAAWGLLGSSVIDPNLLESEDPLKDYTRLFHVSIFLILYALEMVGRIITMQGNLISVMTYAYVTLPFLPLAWTFAMLPNIQTSLLALSELVCLISLNSSFIPKFLAGPPSRPTRDS